MKRPLGWSAATLGLVLVLWFSSTLATQHEIKPGVERWPIKTSVPAGADLSLGKSVSEPRNFKSPFAAANPCLLPPAARHDRAPGGRSQAPPGGRCPVAVLSSGAPSTTLPAWRKAERGRSPNAGGRPTSANARSEGWADDFRDGVAGSVTAPRAGASAPAPPRATRSRAPAARARPAGSRPPCAPPQAAAGRRSADTGKRPGRTPGAAAPPTTTAQGANPRPRATAPPTAPSPRWAPPPWCGAVE